MGSLSQFPDLVRNAFVNQQLNKNGIINVRFFIRGKPWVVSVDDTFLFYGRHAGSWDATMESHGKSGQLAGLVFA